MHHPTSDHLKIIELVICLGDGDGDQMLSTLTQDAATSIPKAGRDRLVATEFGNA